MANKEQEIVGESVLVSNEVDVIVENTDSIPTEDKSLFSMIQYLYYEQRITNKILMEVFDVTIMKKDLK